MQLRDADITDCEALSALCYRSKASWGYSEAFMAQCKETLTLTPAKLQEWVVRVAEAEGRLLGVMAFSVDQRDAELELLFIDTDLMRAGVGRALMEDAQRLLLARGVDTLWILSDPGAEAFYLKLGAERIGLRPSDAIAGRSLPWLRLACSYTRA